MTTVQGYDPRTGDPSGAPVAATTDTELAEVMAAAVAAGAAHDRARALDTVASALDAVADELVHLADAETALGEARLRGEVARTTNQLRMFAGLVRDGSYVRAILSPRTDTRPDVRRMLRPLGPVAVFAASNFPFAFSVAGGDTASALAAGCPVIVKAHEGHPRTSERTGHIVADALRRAGAPAGTFAVVHGVDAGRALVVHPAVTAVGFTGSTAGGRALFDLAAGRPDPIPFYGELGSVNPVVILPGAATERAVKIADGFAGSLTLGTGQFCTNPGLVFAPDDPGLMSAMTAAVAATSGGPMLTEKIRAGYRRAVGEWTDLPLLAAGTGHAPRSVRPEVRTIPMADFTVGPLTEERFGPAALVVTYREVTELIPVLGTLPGSLTASIHAAGDDRDAAVKVAEQLRSRAGRLIMNGWPTGVAVCWAMHHGGPWPSSTAAAATSVGALAMERWLTPVAYQDWPDELLPPELQAANPCGITRVEQPGR